MESWVVLSYFTGTSLVLFLGVIWLIFLTLSLRRYQSGQKKVHQLMDKENLASAMASSLKDIDSLRGELQEVTARQQELGELSKQAIQKVGIVRFDAFKDLGGELSFAAALLDCHGDGLVISSIYGAGESHSYAKPVKGKKSNYRLFSEEQKAIAEAFQ